MYLRIQQAYLMISNEEYVIASSDKSINQHYADFAELLYDIYTESRIVTEDENIDAKKSQKLELDYE